jgi:glyoxylase-like metal-dependent hydrolase (beta-lactamase superfamily II)
MARAFASAGDTAEKEVTFSEVGPGLYAFTAQGDPNSGVIVGDDAVMVVEAQATPRLARKVLDCIRSVTDLPVTHLVLTHYHAVRVLGASAYGAPTILMSDAARAMVVERGQEDWDSEFARFPRLFQGHEEIPGLTWPTATFRDRMSVYLGRRRVDLRMLGRGHTAGDIVVHVPDADAMFTGDLVEHRSACYCGDAHFHDWPGTLAAIRGWQPGTVVPGRGDALQGRETVEEALDGTLDFLVSTWRSVARVATRGGTLKEAMAACREVCDPKFSDWAIYEHCLPFNVARAFDEARGVAHPRIWTAERDAALWEALQS